MPKMNGQTVYPLRTAKTLLGSAPVYDRENTGRSWFILDFWSGASAFCTRDGEQLMTRDGKAFGNKPSRTGGHIPY